MKKLFTLALLVLATTFCWAGQEIDAGYFSFVVPDGYKFERIQLGSAAENNLTIYFVLNDKGTDVYYMMGSEKFQGSISDDVYKELTKYITMFYTKYEIIHEYNDKIYSRDCRHTEMIITMGEEMIYGDFIAVKDNYSDHFMIICVFAPDRLSLMNNVKKHINNINFYY